MDCYFTYNAPVEKLKFLDVLTSFCYMRVNWEIAIDYINKPERGPEKKRAKSEMMLTY